MKKIFIIITLFFTGISASATNVYLNIPGVPAGYNGGTVVGSIGNDDDDLKTYLMYADTIFLGFYKFYLLDELQVSCVVLGGCYWDVTTQTVKRKYPGAANNNTAEMTVLDGNSLRQTLPEHKNRVATVNTGGVIDGCLIRNGHVRGDKWGSADSAACRANGNGHGGGVLVNGGMVSNCIIRGNVAMNVTNAYRWISPINTPRTIGTTLEDTIMAWKEAHFEEVNPSRGGGVYVITGHVVNCIITANMDDIGSGVDGYSGYVVNNTIVRNTQAPTMVKINGRMTYETTYGWSNYFATLYRILDDFYIASTECTQSQYSCFIAAIDFQITQNNAIGITEEDRNELVGADAPSNVAGYRSLNVSQFYGLTSIESTGGIGLSNTNPQYSWDLIGTTTTADNQAAYLCTPVLSTNSVIYPGRTSKQYDEGSSGDVSFPADPQWRDNFPVAGVSWYGGMCFSTWLGGTLPTEAEWEYAGRMTASNTPIASEATVTNGVNDPTAPTGEEDSNKYRVGWSSGNSGEGKTSSASSRMMREVGTRLPTQIGLYDMLGNVNEWCADWHDNDLGLAQIPAENRAAQPPTISILNTSTDGGYMVSADGNGFSGTPPLHNPINNSENGRYTSYTNPYTQYVRAFHGDRWNITPTSFQYRSNGVPSGTYFNYLGFRPCVCPMP